MSHIICALGGLLAGFMLWVAERRLLRTQLAVLRVSVRELLAEREGEEPVYAHVGNIKYTAGRVEFLPPGSVQGTGITQADGEASTPEVESRSEPTASSRSDAELRTMDRMMDVGLINETQYGQLLGKSETATSSSWELNCFEPSCSEPSNQELSVRRDAERISLNEQLKAGMNAAEMYTRLKKKK